MPPESLAAESAHHTHTHSHTLTLPPAQSINETHPQPLILPSTAASTNATKARTNLGLPITKNGQPNPPGSAIDGIVQSLHVPTGSLSEHRNYTDNKRTILMPSEPRHSINQDVSVDDEKQSSDHRITRLVTERHSSNDQERTIVRDPEELRLEYTDPAQHAAWVLLYLSLLSPFLALLTYLYSIIMFAILLLLTPCYLCTAHKPLTKQLSDLLLPLLRLQLRLIYSSTESVEHGHVSMLVLVSLGSPLYSIGIAIAAWVAAAFWAYAGILGDPDGSEQHDDDGREAVLRVRRWWQRWLEKGMI